MYFDFQNIFQLLIYDTGGFNIVFYLIRNLDILPKIIWTRKRYFKLYNFIWNTLSRLSLAFYHHGMKPRYFTEYQVMNAIFLQQLTPILFFPFSGVLKLIKSLGIISTLLFCILILNDYKITWILFILVNWKILKYLRII